MPGSGATRAAVQTSSTAPRLLLKPFENSRFRQTLDRAREAVGARGTALLRTRLLALLEGRPVASPAAAPEPAAFPGRIAVEMRGQVRVVPVAEVDFFDVEGDYVAVHPGAHTYPTRDTLGGLESCLNPARFFRIHRSTIACTNRIEALLTAPGGDYAARLRDGKRLKVARSRRDALAEHLGIER